MRYYLRSGWILHLSTLFSYVTDPMQKVDIYFLKRETKLSGSTKLGGKQSCHTENKGIMQMWVF